MGVVVMDGGHDHHGAGACGHQLANQTLAGAIGQTPVHEGQAIGMVAHAGPRGRQRGHSIHLAHSGQGLGQQFGEPLARLVEVFHHECTRQQGSINAGVGRGVKRRVGGIQNNHGVKLTGLGRTGYP